jgi:hypothetical protein
VLGRVSVGIAAVVLIAAAGCGSGDSDSSSVSATQANTTTRQQQPHSGPVRAEMVPGLSYTSSTVQWPQNGGWEAETRGEAKQIFVLAGGDHHSHVPGNGDRTRNGLIQILRSGNVDGHEQGNKFVVVHGTGAIRVTKAPVGKALPASVLHSDIEFTSQNGVTGTLHLSDDAVTLDR